jgi:hypothetical protein
MLDIPEVRQRVSPLSVEEYHRLDEYKERGRRTELIRGFVSALPCLARASACANSSRSVPYRTALAANRYMSPR